MSGYVYFVQCEGGGPVKIGATRNLEQRLLALQTGCPFPLRLLSALPTADPLGYERHLHRRFARHRLDGEWFKPCPDMETLLDMTIAGDASPTTVEKVAPPRRPPCDLPDLQPIDADILAALATTEWRTMRRMTRSMPTLRNRMSLLKALERLWRRELVERRTVTGSDGSRTEWRLSPNCFPSDAGVD